ncbi:MAG: acetate--CoA ligase family protein, partial [Actinomycetota bacterium]|nr:acetate--CoA ligase family protein [Actinomycetota bacterium]
MEKQQIIEKALERNQKALSEHDSKLLLASYDVPIPREVLAKNEDEAVSASRELGYPAVLKACGAEISHKTERNLVAVGLKGEDAVREAYRQIVRNLEDEPYEGILVYKMIEGERELVMGLVRDPQFGPCVMFGLGGIFTEILKDTSFRVAPISERDALQMMEEIKASAILGPVRGMAPAKKEILAKALIGLGNLGMEHEEVQEEDVNPLII